MKLSLPCRILPTLDHTKRTRTSCTVYHRNTQAIVFRTRTPVKDNWSAKERAASFSYLAYMERQVLPMIWRGRERGSASRRWNETGHQRLGLAKTGWDFAFEDSSNSCRWYCFSTASIFVCSRLAHCCVYGDIVTTLVVNIEFAYHLSMIVFLSVSAFEASEPG